MELLPTWHSDIHPENNYLVLTNDMDSYYSCRILQKHTGLEIGGFYSFDGGLYLKRSVSEAKEPIFVDLSISVGKTFDNHYTFIKNPEAINPNVIKQPYFKKYNGGTLALVASMYENLSQYSEKQWMALLVIDGFYLGYYNSNGKFRDVNLYWFDKLGITEYVVPILEKKSAKDFSDFQHTQRLDELISINEAGELECRKNIILPDGPFHSETPIEKKFMPKWEAVILYEKHPDSIIVSNEVYSGKYVINMESGASERIFHTKAG